MTLEWADYAAVQAKRDNQSRNELPRNVSGNIQPVISAHLATVDWSWHKEWN